ncbi:MAG: DUF4358 domain-containing protein [Clostridiaceae bacterium]|nr:DUF4358 domain-containing protein [Clostridiaceae bacterium]
MKKSEKKAAQKAREMFAEKSEKRQPSPISAEKQGSEKKQPSPIPVEKRSVESYKPGKSDYRILVICVMYLFVAFIMIWGITRMVKNINTAGKQLNAAAAGSETVENNSQNEGKEIDVDALIAALLDQVAFDGELELLEETVAAGMVDTAEGTSMQIYMGSGTHSDEIIVMTATDETAAEENQQYAQTHLTEMKNSFQDYLPEEAKKIEDAVCVRCGDYVIVCVTSDADTAKEIIDDVVK